MNIKVDTPAAATTGEIKTQQTDGLINNEYSPKAFLSARRACYAGN